MDGISCLCVEQRNAYTIFVGKSERKIYFGISRCRWEDTIETNVKDEVCDGVDMINFSQYTCEPM
jgi:hypothetical protein